MNPARWQQVKDVLTDALERVDPAERSAFLAHACAHDTALRREVESLLAHSSERLEACAGEMRLASELYPDPMIGCRVGAYKIVRELGRGGMGTVFLAERADREFQKQVAIKILKRGTDTDEVLRRFRSEREILARLEHPNIARLLDGGTTEEGLPYFIMEYVAGSRVTDFCAERDLSIAERLRLFLDICGAVQFAHQNLIVHRDLKPANILINGEGKPKLLDFGIAKLLAPEGGASELTIQDQQRLTPAYASPEQVRGEPITTVSDVYALGALLYELLTGKSAHRFASERPSPTELWRVVGEETPIRPSLAMTGRHQSRQLRGDLDNIILTALRKEPPRRYAGVGAFAEDVWRHLEKRPVRARRATMGYRTAKFFQRNKTITVAAALVLVALFGGTTLALISARRAQGHARRAERHFRNVRELANSFLFEFHDAIATLPGATTARQLIVARALQYLDRLAPEAADDAALQMELAQAYLKVGDVQGKPYAPNLGDTVGAMRSYSKAIEIAERLLTGQNESATTASRVLANASANLAGVQSRIGDLDSAQRNNARALKIAERLVKEDPAGASEWRALIVACEIGLGDAIEAGNHREEDPVRFRSALEHYRRALAISEELLAATPDSVAGLRRLAKSGARVAALLAELGKQTNEARTFEECFALHRRTLALHEAALKLEPDNATIRRNIADELVMTAYAHALAGRDLEEAIAQCTRALEIDQALTAADPSNVEAQQDLSFAHYVAGRLFQAKGDRVTAREHYAAALQILEPLVRAHAGNVETSFDLERVRRGLEETKAAPSG